MITKAPAVQEYARAIIRAHGRLLSRFPGARVELESQHGTLLTEDQAEEYLGQGSSVFWRAYGDAGTSLGRERCA